MTRSYSFILSCASLWWSILADGGRLLYDICRARVVLLERIINSLADRLGLDAKKLGPQGYAYLVGGARPD